VSHSLAITTDYVADTGDPEPYLRRAAEAGFTHIHWCHHWNTDFVYHPSEVAQIRAWLETYGLRLLDVHGSAGVEKDWTAAEAYRRQAGVELVKNRVDLAADLGADVVIMHLFPPSAPEERSTFWEQARRTLDELEPYCRTRGVRLALENLFRLRQPVHREPRPEDFEHNFDALVQVLDLYPPDYLGYCHDSGHATLTPGGMERAWPLADRLLAVHLHDNDGTWDQHRLPYDGITDWEWTASFIARSSYTKPLSLEVSIHLSGLVYEAEFLERAHARGRRLHAAVARLRERGPGPGEAAGS